jgi:hypothetical protein
MKIKYLLLLVLMKCFFLFLCYCFYLSDNCANFKSKIVILNQPSVKKELEKDFLEELLNFPLSSRYVDLLRL